MKKSDIRQLAAVVKEVNIPFGVNRCSVLDLIKRVAGPVYSEKFIFESKDAEKTGMDSYILEDTDDGHIRIAATSGVAAASAFRWYLLNRCNSYIGPLTKRLDLPAVPPKVGDSRKQSSPFLYRYFLNFCTFGYTFCFWKWEQWEPFLDWAVMSGYNLILNPVGHEAVWVEVLKQNGYTDRVAREFICGPTFFPWQCMMNLTSWGGSAPKSWINDRIELAKRINDRLCSLGVGIMLPGYSGMVPVDFAEYNTNSKPLDQGEWCGFKRPLLLLPDDPCFNGMAESFYKVQMSIFGDNIHYFSTDPFHEGGDSSKVDLEKYAVGCYEKMKIASKNAVWFFQGWQDNPIRGILNSLPTEKVLVGNLRAEDCADGKDNFSDHPWLYCCVNNFGGQRVVRGNIRKLINEPHQILEDENYTMVGIGCLPEGVETDEIFFDILAELSFSSHQPNENDCLRTLITHRYGSCPDSVYRAWSILKDEVYLGDTSSDPKESAFCTRPSLTVNMVSTYVSGKFNYAKEALEEALRLLSRDYGELECKPFCLDITDFARQALANKAWNYVEGLQKAFIDKNVYDFNKNAEKFLSLYYLQDSLVSTNPHMLLGRWLELAKSHAADINEEAYYEYLARTLITLWGDRTASIGLRDYAAKEWNGMLLDFYRPRWESYIRMLRIALVTGREINEYNRYDAEYFFTTLGGLYPTEPKGNLEKIIENVLSEL